MRPHNFALPWLISHYFTILASLDWVRANPPFLDFFPGDYSSFEPEPDDLYNGLDRPQGLPPDLVADPSLMASGLLDFGSSDALGSTDWDSPIEITAPNSFFLQSSCQMPSEDLFGDVGLADDWMLRARDNNGAACADPESDQTINFGTIIPPQFNQEIPKIPGTFSPLDIKKPQKDTIPPVVEYGDCFLPFLTRCCCVGSLVWGDKGLWGFTLDRIDDCSVGTYISSNRLYMQIDVRGD